MKRILFVVAMSLLFVVYSQAQSKSEPSKVVKAAIFDKSPPLRDMEIIEPYPLDNSWKKGVIKNESVGYGDDLSTRAETDPGSVQSKMGTKSVKGPIVNIDGTGNVNGVYPPDTDGDVGPDHYFQMINLSFAIYDKSGSKLYGPVSNSTLWSNFPGPWQGTNDGDPILIYDDLADRWVASQFAVWTSNNKFYELIAVSETGDPLGSWYRYAFEFDDFPDYPKLSVWHDGYYATFHMFTSNLTQFLGTAFVAFEREKMLTGDPDAQMVYYGEYGSLFGYQPADADGAAPPDDAAGLFMGINFFGNQNLEVRKLQVDWDNPSNSVFSLAATLSTPSFNNINNGIPQPGTSTLLAPFNNNLMYRVPYRNYGSYQSMAANHTVKVGSVSGIRWYEVRNDGSGWYIYQNGTYQPDNHHRWMGSIALGADGSIALGYSVSSSTIYPSIRYTGRTPDAPLGEMDVEEVEVIAGLSSQSSIDRWGDYASMTSDPTGEGVYWFTTEYMKAAGWGTRIVSFDFEELQPPVIFAGEDVSICENSLFEANGTGLYLSAVHWESTGDGTFQNPNILNAKYLRGNGDIQNGGVNLILTGYGYEVGWEVTDSVYVTILEEPEAFAGNDTTVHFNNNLYLMGATAEDYGSVEWSTSGDGYFIDPGLVNASYVVGNQDVANGQVELTLTAYPQAPCEDDDSDKVVVAIDPTVGIDPSAASYRELLALPNPTKGIFTLSSSRMEAGEYSLKVTDLTGAVVYEKKLNMQNGTGHEVDISGQPDGLYVIELKGKGQTITERILKN